MEKPDKQTGLILTDRENFKAKLRTFGGDLGNNTAILQLGATLRKDYFATDIDAMRFLDILDFIAEAGCDTRPVSFNQVEFIRQTARYMPKDAVAKAQPRIDAVFEQWNTDWERKTNAAIAKQQADEATRQAQAAQQEQADRIEAENRQKPKGLLGRLFRK
ncbi:MAG: hypothetical protein AAB403_03655 [Planctomycetota bacterium]